MFKDEIIDFLDFCNYEEWISVGGYSRKKTDEILGSRMLTFLQCSQSRWNPGRYSLLAGFVEIGETFEMAVAREVKEESGIDIDRTTVRCFSRLPTSALCHCMLQLYILCIHLFKLLLLLKQLCWLWKT